MSTTTARQILTSLGACGAAIDSIPPTASLQEAWAACTRGDWMLWYLNRVGVDARSVGFWCAERARQHALRALPPSPERDALERCAPVVDEATAEAAEEAAAWAANAAGWAAGAAARAARAARAAAGAAARAAAEAAMVAARVVAWVAEATEHAVQAEYVRSLWPVVPVL